MGIIILLILGAVTVFTPYMRGLFFDGDLYIVEIVIMLCFIAWMAVSFFTKKQINSRYLIMFLVPFMFVVAFIHAESPSFNFDNLFRWLAYSCFFVLLTELRKDKRLDRYMPVVFQITGIALALFSYFGWLGWLEYRDVVVSDRLSGPFQYPNVFAAVIGAYWLYSLIRLTENAKNIGHKLLYGAPLVLFGTSFLLAFSRGALLLIPVAWLIGLLLLKPKAQIQFLIYTLLSSGLSIVMIVLPSGIDQPGNLLAMFIMLVSSAVMFLVGHFVTSRSIESANREPTSRMISKYGRWLIPSAVLVIGGLLVLDLLNQGLVYRVLPSSIQAQVNTINLEATSALGRMGMYDDAFRISTHYPIIGAGGDGWRLLYGQFQTEPYLSNEIHNGYLEMLLNIGYVGFIVFILVFVMLAYAIFVERSRREEDVSKIPVTAAITACALMFMHSFLDFNFSFGSFWFIALWLMAMVVPVDDNIKLLPDKMTVSGGNLLRYASIVGKVSITVFILVGLFFNIRVYSAQEITIISGTPSLQEAIDKYESAYRRNPYNVNYGINLARFYSLVYTETGDDEMKEQARMIMDKIVRTEPNNSKILYAVGEIHANWQEWDDAFAYMETALDKEPFEINFYNGLITIQQQIASAYSVVDTERSLTYYQSVIDTYERYMDWYVDFKDIYIPDMRNINLSKQAVLAASRSYQAVGKPEQALELLQRYNPVFDEGIYDEESDQLLIGNFEILTFEDVLQQYSGERLIMSVQGEAVRRLPNEVIEIMRNMGSSIESLQEDGSYIAIIYDNQIIEEKINNEDQIMMTNDDASLETDEVLGHSEFVISSAGSQFGNRSSIVIDGVEYSSDKRGFNIVVFNSNMRTMGTMYFDTHISDVRITR